MFDKKNKKNKTFIEDLPKETLEKLENNTLDFNVMNDTKDDVKEVKEIENKEESIPCYIINENIDYKSRGFETLEQASEFVYTTQFIKLGQADKDEYIAWLRK